MLSFVPRNRKNILTLKQFMLRTETLQLYRNVLRQLKKISNKSEKEEIQKWTREEFEKNRNLTDEYAIRGLLVNGKKQLRDLEKAINLAKS